MARKEHGRAAKGSEKWLQLAANEYSVLSRTLIAKQLQLDPSNIEWLSPLECDGYAEYTDQDFINLLGVELKGHPLKKFWPNSGPNWDGLVKTDRSQVLLVEAKAHIDEMDRQGSSATNPESIEQIACSLKETQQFLDADHSIDWAKYPIYQYANRLAHLYLLAELNGIDSYLLMIYFLNDTKMGGPDSSDLWEDAIHKQYVHMGLPQDHRLSDRIINLYLDVRELGE